MDGLYQFPQLDIIELWLQPRWNMGTAGFLCVSPSVKILQE